MRLVGLVAVLAVGTSACGGSNGGDGGGVVDDGADGVLDRAPAVDVPSLDEALASDVDDQRDDVRRVLGGPDAFRVAFVPVTGGVVRYETWDYLELETRIDFVDGAIALTADLEPLPDGSWFPHHVDPSDFVQGMSAADVGEQLAGIELQELDLSEVVDGDGTALVGGQLLVTFSDDVIVTAESFPLVPDPTGMHADLVEAVTP